MRSRNGDAIFCSQSSMNQRLTSLIGKSTLTILLFLGISASSNTFADTTKVVQAVPTTASAPAAAGGDAVSGEAIFKANCKQCHAIADVVI